MTADTTPSPQFITLEVSAALEIHSQIFPGGGQTERQLHRLATTLAASEPWRTLRDSAAMVIATEPEPSLSIIGRFDAAGEQRLLQLERALQNDLPSLRYVDWSHVQRDVARLATRLRQHLGAQLDEARFTAIPRGGLIVLGLLAYELGLSALQLSHGVTPSTLTVIVDDCALTGLRFRDVLANTSGGDVVFAHLYSAPELRRALQQLPDVTTCVAAQDLTDRAPDMLGDGYTAWRERWETRVGDRTAWVGMTERLAFPWSEPDATFWNTATQRDEPGWKLVPLEYCAASTPPPRASIQVRHAAAGPVQPSPAAIWAGLGEETIVANSATGRAYSLAGVAADMWTALVEHGDMGRASRHLAAKFDASPSRIQEDLRQFVTDLQDAGLLGVEAAPLGTA